MIDAADMLVPSMLAIGLLAYLCYGIVRMLLCLHQYSLSAFYFVLGIAWLTFGLLLGSVAMSWWSRSSAMLMATVGTGLIVAPVCSWLSGDYT